MFSSISLFVFSIKFELNILAHWLLPNSFVVVAWKSEGCFTEHKKKAKMVLRRKIATVGGKKLSIQDVFDECKSAAEKKGFKIFGIRVSTKDFFNLA